MPIQATEKIWHNGKWVNWDDAKLHVLSHVVSYGSAVFEGIRCYETKQGPAIFRLREHMQRLINSAKIYRMDLPYSVDQFANTACELVRLNKLNSCYVKPIVLRGYGEVGVNPLNSPIDIYMACWSWGAYLGPEALSKGVDVGVSSWTRIAPNTLPAMSKAAANYMNSQLIRMEASFNGYTEGIALDSDGHVSEGSGMNVFLVHEGVLYTRHQHFARHHSRRRRQARDRPQHSIQGNGYPARNALHRRRSFLCRHGRRNHSYPLRRPHPDRQGRRRANHPHLASGILRHHQRHQARSPQLAHFGKRARQRRHALIARRRSIRGVL